MDTKTQYDLFSPSATSLSILGRHFVDGNGRILLLRGANVASASKVPVFPEAKIHEHATASYIGRPFPLEAAPEHWARLRSWGLTFIRINVTWDAIEHAGPGLYDREYLSYLRDLLQSLSGTGLVAYISMHQDVWSRYSGGSGAPGWTLEAAGFDLSKDGEALTKSGAAFLDGVRGGRLKGERGLWPTGYQKLAAATMNTLFWGGDIFAPSLKISTSESGQIGIQQFLQSTFLKTYEQLIEAVGDLDTVMGFEALNEPHPGYIGLPTIDEWNYSTDLHLGLFPSPLQSFSLGEGHPTAVPSYVRSFPYPTRVSKRVIANTGGVVAWSSGSCPWKKEGVWSWSTEKNVAVALQEDYFSKDRSGRKVDFYKDCYFPFIRRWEETVNAKQPGKARMAEVIPNEYCPVWPEQERPKNFVYAPHWYDLYTMFTKRLSSMTVNVQGLSRGMFAPRALYFGKQVKDNYALQIRTLVGEARAKLGEIPIVFGECGIPIDLNYEQAFSSGDWKWQERMLDALLSAMESNLVHFNLWSYNPANRDEVGDDWNAENFSWYSDENRKKALATIATAKHNDLDAGSRLLNVLVRPYAIATAGTPLSSHYQVTTALFTYRYQSVPQAGVGASPPLARVTEIFLPKRIYHEGNVKWNVTAGGRVKFDWERERLFIWFDDDAEKVRKGKEVWRRLDIWVRDAEDETTLFNGLILALMAIVVAFFAASEISRYHTGVPWVNLPNI